MHMAETEAGELGGELETESAAVPQDAQDALSGALPPDEPQGPADTDGDVSDGGGLLPAGLDTKDKTFLHASTGYVNTDLDPLIYVLAFLDARGERASEYEGMGRSQVLGHYLTRLAMEELRRQLVGGRYKGLLNAIGDQALAVQKRAARKAYGDLYDRAQQDIIRTLAEHGIADREAMEETLGVVNGDAIA